MKQFIKDMLSYSGRASHKRVIAFTSFLMLVIMVIAKFFNTALDEHLIYVFAGLVAGESGLSILDKYKKNNDQ